MQRGLVIGIENLLNSAAFIAHTAYNSRCTTFKDKGRAEKERIIYLSLRHFCWVLVILEPIFINVSNLAFIDDHVLISNNHTVSGHDISCLKLNDISDNEIIDADGLGDVLFATDNWDLLFLKPLLKVDESFVHRIVIIAREGH